MKDIIIHIAIDNQGHLLGLSNSGKVYQLNDKDIDHPLWEHVIDSPERQQFGETPIHKMSEEAIQQAIEPKA